MTDPLDRLRDAVRSSRNWTPNLDVERDVTPLLARGAHAEVIALVSARMPGAYLSPSAHTILAAAHDALGEHEPPGGRNARRGGHWPRSSTRATAPRTGRGGCCG